MRVIAAIDQGTTSSRSMLFSENGEIVSQAQKEFQQIFPQPGWVEHNPLEIFETQKATLTEVLTQANKEGHEVAAIGITNQRETTLLWERSSGKPIYNAIVWQDRRTSDHCARIKKQGLEASIKEKTGLEIDPYFSATKLAWLLENVTGARARAEKGELAFGTIDTWILWQLTKGRVHATDVSNASRTMLMNIYTGNWDQELLKVFNIPEAILPKITSSSEFFGEFEYQNKKIPIGSCIGDQQAALFGQRCLMPGQVKNTYGTGCFLLECLGNKPVQSKNKLLTTVAWKISKDIIYALEGSVFMGGALVQWLRDGLGIITSSSEVSKLAQSVPDSGGVVLVPAFAGLGAPYWDPYARGSIFGMTRGTTKAHIARAAEEAICHQVTDLLEAMTNDTKAPPKEVRVDGGAVRDDLLLQIQADFLGVPVLRSKNTESTALGAALLAGLAVGIWKSESELSNNWEADKVFEPRQSREAVKELRREWAQAVKRAQGWLTSEIGN